MPVPISQRPHDTTDPTSTDGFKSGLYSTDVDGIPYYVFGPAWPVLPTGVTVQSFSQFSAKGIIVDADDGGLEVDGEGVPTTRLDVVERYAGAEDCDTKKAKKKKQKVASALAAAAKPWHEIWKEAELAGPIRLYDRCSSRRERLSNALDDFAAGRFWTPHLQSIFDLLRQFLGLNNNPNRLLAGSVDDDDELELLDEEITLDALDGAQFMREAMMDRFALDPERATKVFLSSYFSHSGMIWFHAKSTDAPTLARFFLAFLLKNNVFPDRTASLANGVLIAEQAHDQLQACWTLSQAMALNELLGALCIDTFGTIDNFPGAITASGNFCIASGEQRLETVIPGQWEVVYAESSCRIVTRVTRPDEALFGVVALTLWGGPNSLDLSATRVLRGDHAGERERDIDVLVNIDVLAAFEQGVGLIVQGTWAKVQHVECELLDGQDVWWYCERLHGTFPSYWANDEFEQDY